LMSEFQAIDEAAAPEQDPAGRSLADEIQGFRHRGRAIVNGIGKPSRGGQLGTETTDRIGPRALVSSAAARANGADTAGTVARLDGVADAPKERFSGRDHASSLHCSRKERRAGAGKSPTAVQPAPRPG